MVSPFFLIRVCHDVCYDVTSMQNFFLHGTWQAQCIQQCNFANPSVVRGTIFEPLVILNHSVGRDDVLSCLNMSHGNLVGVSISD